MTENEVIIVDGIPRDEYSSLIENCVKYAIISLPFTVNRMSIPDEKKRAMNIAKGKIAETLFNYFCFRNGLSPDFNSCATPFWTVDNRDFILNGSEWDIKNNFYYCDGNEYNGRYTNFPALIPNRFEGDQWSKKDKNLISGTNGVSFLFTFLKDANLLNGVREREFLELNISSQQLNFIAELYQKYQGMPQTNEPFSESWFWSEFNKLGGATYYTLHDYPSLIITAYANANYWGCFQNTGKFDRTNALQDAVAPQWYSKAQSGAINFLNGTMWTVITNMTCPISNLPSFLSMFPKLKDSMNCGHIKHNI